MTITSSPATFHSDVDGVGEFDGHFVGTSQRKPTLLLRRLVARAIDMFTVLFVTLALVLIGFAPLMDNASSRWAPEPWGRAFAATVLYTMVATIYEVVFVATRGQTPGKDVCHVKVVRSGSGETPGWSRSLVRAVPFALLRLCPGVELATALPLTLGLTTAVDRRGRSIHDLIAGTMVIGHDANDAVVDNDPGDDERDDDRGDRRINRDDLAATYGPRSIRDLMNRRIDRR